MGARVDRSLQVEVTYAHREPITLTPQVTYERRVPIRLAIPVRKEKVNGSEP